MRTRNCFALFALCILAVSWAAIAQEDDLAEDPTQQISELNNGDQLEPRAAIEHLTWNSPLVIVQCVWMTLIAVGAPLYAVWVGKKGTGEGVVNPEELRGLNLPRGSLRGILALVTIGSFVNVMVLGAPVLGNYFDSVLAAFGTLTGSIVGFYFGTRGATPQDST